MLTGVRAAAAGGKTARRPALPTVCRSCATELTTAATRKVGRCGDCPPTYDPVVFESLRSWRAAVAKATAVPAYVVFTDATLTAIAESRPEALPAVAAVSGVGARKLELYGQAVLDVVSGADPQEVAARSVKAD